MIVKAAFHLHIDQDPIDQISYTGFQAIDRASQLGFQVISFTCHEKLIDINPYLKYAESKGVLLIPGIEKTIQKKHVLILNAQQSAENINSFQELATYKNNNPNSYIIAPHPYFHLESCLKNKLIQYIHLFDAIEFNYCYHKLLNPNKRAIKVAQQYNKTLIGTSDIHHLEYFDSTYTELEIKKLDIPSVIIALKQNQLEVITKSFSIFGLIKIIYKVLSIGTKKDVLQK